MDWRRIPAEVTVAHYSRLEKRLYAPQRHRMANLLRQLRADNRMLAFRYWHLLRDASRGFRV